MLIDSNAMKIITYDILSVNIILAIWHFTLIQPNLNFFIRNKYFNVSINNKDIVTFTTMVYSFYVLRKYN